MLSKKELEQAFPETPDIVHHRIYQAFRKGEKKLKARRRMVQSLSFAAAFVMMLCMGLLMRHVYLSPPGDALKQGGDVTLNPGASATIQIQVTGSPQPAETAEVTVSPAVTPEPTPYPTATAPTEAPTDTPVPPTEAPTDTPVPPTEAPTDTPQPDVVYDVNPGEDASASVGVVIDSEVQEPQPMPFYSTESGQYYHVEESCGGMKNAQQITFQEAVSQGKTACPGCLGGSLETVYLTDGGYYYHTDTACLSNKSIKKAAGHTEDYALLLGALPCPDCTGANYDLLDENMLTLQFAAGELVVYTHTSGTDYHRTADPCGSMYDKYDKYPLLLGPALREGCLPCEGCYPGWKQDAPLYFTPGGTYFHTDSACTGMKNASPYTLEVALNCGKAACPVCCPFAAGDRAGAHSHLTYLFETLMGVEIPFPQDKTDLSADSNDQYYYGYQAYYGDSEMDSDQLDIIVAYSTVNVRMMYAQADGMRAFVESCGNDQLRTAYEEINERLLQLGEADAYLKAVQLNATLGDLPYIPQETSYEFAYVTAENPDGVDTLCVNYDAIEQKISYMEWSTVPGDAIPVNTAD